MAGPVPPTKAELKKRINRFDPETQQNEGIPLLVNPCEICRLNPTSTDIREDEDSVCPSLNGPQGYNCEYLKIEKKTPHLKIAALLMRRFSFKTLKDTDQLLIWENGVYNIHGDIIAKQQLEKIHGDHITRHKCNEIIAHIQRSTYVKREEFDKDPNLLTVENGVLNIETGLLNNFDPRHLSLIKIPVIHDPDAECPVIDRFIHDVADPADVERLYEIIGYCLEHGYPIQKAFMLIGGGNNGKSTYLSLIAAFLGQKNISAESITNLIDIRFSPARLHGKLANISADLSNVDLKKTGIFKMLTGGVDIISAEHKNQPGFEFTNRAKLLYSTNTMPRTEDVTDAFYRRWDLTTFPNKFEGDNLDLNILDKLTTPEELSGLLNVALKKLHNLRKNRKFTGSLTTDEIRGHYMKLSNPVYAFIEDQCEYTEKDKTPLATPKKDFYPAFNIYCKDNKIAPVSEDRFNKQFKQIVTANKVREQKIKKINHWTGITIKGINPIKGYPPQQTIDDLFVGGEGGTLDTLDTLES